MPRVVIGIVLLVAFVALALIDRLYTPLKNPALFAQTQGAERCANAKLPSYFASDARVVRRDGGAPPRYVDQGDHFLIGQPTGVPTPAPVATGAAFGDGTMRVVSVERPDSGTWLLAVAANENDREQGLMCVTSMAPRVGMIFVFKKDAQQNFWMKDTLIPLDMLFVDDDGRVSAVAANVPSSRIDQAEDSVARRSGSGRYVIELNAGQAKRDGVAVGTHLKIPHLRYHD